ncbi:MAG: threonylcarbamoyl-AMP synthase [Methylococcaceae bacterium]|nr:threonylcarbamoyl-AMP synthase [Methylococcaceae bacterium]
MHTPSPVIANTASIQQAVALLRQGRLVAFPTETVYGLGADARNPDAIRRIFAAKGRPADHPLIVHIPSPENLADWAATIPDSARQLARQFWPGPLALILSKRPDVPLEVTGGQQTIALRVPNHPVALQLLQAFGGGIAAPSANRFCRISPTQAAHVAEELGDTVELILDGGACTVGVESTIVDLTGVRPRLLRPGQITREELEAVLNTELVLPETLKHSKTELRAPGMMAVHYAPLTPALRCRPEQLPDIIQELTAAHKKIGLLTYQTAIAEKQITQEMRLPNQADAYAQGLYTALRKLDQLHLDIIVVEQPPDSEAWRAVNDRLNKATLAY